MSDEIFAAVDTADAAEVTELLAKDPALANAWRFDSVASPLHGCVGKPEIARILLEHEADPNVIDSDEECIAPIHLCAEAGDVTTLRLLVEHGADVNTRSRYGTPLHHALGSNDDGQFPDDPRDVVNCLIELGADINAPIDPDSDDWTPLHQACSEGFDAVVAMLVEKGAKLSTGKDGLTPLRVARSMGFSEIAQILEKRGAS